VTLEPAPFKFAVKVSTSCHASSAHALHIAHTQRYVLHPHTLCFIFHGGRKSFASLVTYVLYETHSFLSPNTQLNYTVYFKTHSFTVLEIKKIL